MKKFFYFIATLAIVTGLSSCGPELIPINGSDLCLIASDQPEYGKYNLYNPLTEQRFYPAIDTAYVVWNQIFALSYKNNKEYSFRNDGFLRRMAEKIYFIEFSENGKDYRFIVYKVYENGQIIYRRCNQNFAWWWDIWPSQFEGISKLPKMGSTTPKDHMIRFTDQDLKKYYILVDEMIANHKLN